MKLLNTFFTQIEKTGCIVHILLNCVIDQKVKKEVKLIILIFSYFILKHISAQTIFISTVTSKNNIFNERILYIKQ